MSAEAQNASVDIMEHLPALLVAIPMMGSAIVAIVRERTFAWLMSAAISFLMPLISLLILHQTYTDGVISYHLGGWEPPLGIEYRIDVANAYVLVIVSVIAAILMPYAKRSVESEIAPHDQGWFYTMYLLCLCGLLGITITGDAFNAFVFLEVSSLSTYAMIALGRNRQALIAAYQYLIIGTLGASLYVLGVGLLYVMTGTLNFADLAERLPNVESDRPILAALAFITVGLSLKIALFPLHKWLPNSYAYAPSMATVFLAATATKVAIYLLVRFIFTIYGPTGLLEGLRLEVVIIAFSLAAMFIASFVACFQQNIERMLAFSSVAQIGYITLGISFLNKTGLTGGLLHLFNHALMKGALFMATGAVMMRVGSVMAKDMAGVGKKMPLTMGAFSLAGLSLIGVPGTVGFESKWFLARAAVETGQVWLVFAIMLSSLIAVVYIGRVVEIAYFREPSPGAAFAKDPPLSMILPLWIMTIACFYFGIDGSLTSDTAARAAEAFLLSAGGAN